MKRASMNSIGSETKLISFSQTHGYAPPFKDLKHV
jgi:hypothetical protein